MNKTLYVADKPDDCSLCYFWKGSRKGCSLGKENCYYLVAEPPKKKSECDGCPYGRNYPCIGWCTKKILRKGYGKETQQPTWNSLFCKFTTCPYRIRDSTFRKKILKRS